MSEEKIIIREIIMSDIEEIPWVVIKAKDLGIRFPKPFVTELINIRTKEKIEGAQLPIKEQYQRLFASAEDCGWELGIETIRESFDLYEEAETKLEKLKKL